MTRLEDSVHSPPRGVFFLLGASGSGKGTVAQYLLETGKLDAHCSMGEILRQRQHDPTLEKILHTDIPVGFSSRTAYLQHAVRSGLLIPDAWTETIVEHELETISPDLFWAFDGYPRTTKAAEHLLDTLARLHIPCLGAVHLRLPYVELERRLLARGRMDDHIASIQNRFAFYQQSVLQTLTFLAQKTLVLEFEAITPPEELAEQIYSSLITRRAPK